MPSSSVSQNLQASLDYRRCGLSVIPLQVRDKKPLIDWKPYQKQPANEVELQRWFGNIPHNIGIVGGAISGGLCIIDFDSMDAYDWWIEQDMRRWLMPAVQTAKGRHVYVRLKQWPGNKRDVERGIDIRGEGGYVVAPPSIHPSGWQYQWIMGGEHVIPTFDSLDSVGLGYLLRPTPLPNVGRQSKSDNDIPYSIVPFVRGGTFIGNRDRKAYWAAMECKNAGVPVSVAISAIGEGLSRSNPDRDPLEWATEKVRSAYGRL